LIIHTFLKLTIRINAYFHLLYSGSVLPAKNMSGMSQFSQSDCAALVECIGELHSFQELEALRAWLLDSALPKLIPSDWLSYNEVDLLQPANTLAILKPEATLIFQRLFPRFQEVAHQNPLIQHQLQSEGASVQKISDFLTQDAFHQLDLYREVYAHMGVEYQLAATIKMEPSRITAFALSRRQPDYTERDRAMLEILRSHLVVAFNHLALVHEQKIKLDYARLTLNELSAATIIVNTHGQILYHTGDGLRWVGAAGQERLPENIAAWVNECSANGSSRMMNLTTDAGSIQIRIVPTAKPERWLLVVTRQSSEQPVVIAGADLGFTRREREVAAWICQGKTNMEVATILGVSPRTIHKHVEHIFEKTGTESRLALTVLLSEQTFRPLSPVAPPL